MADVALLFLRPNAALPRTVTETQPRSEKSGPTCPRHSNGCFLVSTLFSRFGWNGFGTHDKPDCFDSMTNVHLAVQFFLQLAVILLFCRLVGAIALRLGQPQVVAV